MNKMAALGAAITNTEVRLRSQCPPATSQNPSQDFGEDVASLALNKLFQEASSTAVATDATVASPR